MSQSEITKEKRMKVQDILADYFTKDLKVNANKSNDIDVKEDTASDSDSVVSENKKRHHHKKHKKSKKKKKKRSHNDTQVDDELFLLEQNVKKRKLEYERLKKEEREGGKHQQECLATKSKKEHEKVYSKNHLSKEHEQNHRKDKQVDHKHHCRKHKHENPKRKSSVDENLEKSVIKKKLSSTVVLAKDTPERNEKELPKDHTKFKQVSGNIEEKPVKQLSPEIEKDKFVNLVLPLRVSSTDEKALDLKIIDTNEIDKPINNLIESENTECCNPENNINSDIPKETDNKNIDPENKNSDIPKETDNKNIDPENKINSDIPKETDNQNIDPENKIHSDIPKETDNKNIETESNINSDISTKTDKNIETENNKEPISEDISIKQKEIPLKDEIWENEEFSKTKPNKISIQNLKNLDLPVAKDDLKSEPTDTPLEEGEVIDSDEDNYDDEDCFKEPGENKDEHKKKKKHKHKKKKKKKSKDNSKSPESRSHRLSEPSHHHSRSHHHLETEERHLDHHHHHAYKRTSRDRSHSPAMSKRLPGRERRGKFVREQSMGIDLRDKIDKKRLLEIARKNVLSMIEKGTLPSGISANALAQQQLVTLRAGGKSVEELTEFCKGLVNGKDYLSSDTSDEEGRRRPLSEDEGDTPFINHPFKLKEPLPHIRMNIPNAVQIPVRTGDTAKLRQIFPVSSGNQHRIKELEWVPVAKTETATSTTASKKTKEPKAIMPPPPVPAPPVSSALLFPQTSPQLAIGPAPPLTMGASGSLIPMSGPLVEQPPPPPPPPIVEAIPVPPPMVTPPAPAPEPEPEQPPPPGVDISTIVAKRLNAVRRLQENPLDMQALTQMFQAQEQMKDWAHSKLQPGQFGAAPNTRLLTPEELSGPSPVWAKKNQLINAAPVSDGVGMSLLRKMGWNPGEGLGKNKEGSLIPLMLDIKMDKKGLVSTADSGNKAPVKVNMPVKVRQDLSGKHPVSALMELCSKRKWGPPEYTLLDEGGPAHRKNFLFKVRIKGTEYQPSVSSPNKKQAKALAAQVCLQGLGLLPR